jgi:mono/diheme cytochrome c family protein
MGGDDAGDGGEAGETSKAVAPAASATPATGGGDAAPARAAVAPAYTGPVAGPPLRQRVPAWAMPVLVALPLWAMLYAGAFGERKVAAVGPVAKGQSVFVAAGCGGCHGPTGGGGSAPALTEVTKTFPKFEDHVAWVENGSSALKGQPYGATGKIATGGMPSFKGGLTPEEIIAVVCHERVDYGKQDPMPPQCQEGGTADAGGTVTTAGH